MKSKDQLIAEFQKFVDEHDKNNSERRKQIYYDLAVKFFLKTELRREFFAYKYYNDNILIVNRDHVYLKFVIFDGDALPQLPQLFWVTDQNHHYLCESAPTLSLREMTLVFKSVFEGEEVQIGEMPVHLFEGAVQIVKKTEVGSLEFLKDLISADSATPVLSEYYISRVFNIRPSPDDLKSFLQKIDQTLWQQKLQRRTADQQQDRIYFFVPNDLDSKLLLTQEEVDQLLSHCILTDDEVDAVLSKVR